MALPSVLRSDDDLAAALAAFDPSVPVEEAVTPPAAWYTRPDVLDLEQERVLGATWQLAAPAAAVAEPGAFVAGTAGREPFVVVNDGGELRAFYNVCRHHAAAVAPASGRCEAFVCPYHGWTYHLDGRLKSAPKMAGVRRFDKEAMGLRPMAVEQVGPLVLVHPDGGADPLAPRIRPLLERLDATGWADLAHVRTVAYELECNWKVFVDNYLDGGYHVPHMHQGLAAQLDPEAYETEVFGGFSIQASRGASEGEGSGAGGDFRERIGDEAVYGFVFPNLMINRYGPCLDLNVAVPLGPDRCRVVFEYFFTPEAAADQAFVERSLAASDVVQQEDVSVCESVQRGLRSRAYDVGRYAPRVEHAMHAFHVELSRALTGAVPNAPKGSPGPLPAPDRAEEGGE